MWRTNRLRIVDCTPRECKQLQAQTRPPMVIFILDSKLSSMTKTTNARINSCTDRSGKCRYELLLVLSPAAINWSSISAGAYVTARRRGAAAGRPCRCCRSLPISPAGWSDQCTWSASSVVQGNGGLLRSSEVS